jgi:hypothetical protein
MKEVFFFDVTFHDVDLDNWYVRGDNVKPLHHAHLYSSKNEIELKIFYELSTYLGEKISEWASRINWKIFGSYIRTSNVSNNIRLQKIDLSNSSLLGIYNGGKQFEGNLKYVSIQLDYVKFYYSPIIEGMNKAEFYFNDAGFKVVKDFYAPLLGWDNQFSICRMNGMNVFYPIENAEFRPEFNFCYSDGKSKRKVTIRKEPKLQFHYKQSITEDKAIKYAEVIRVLASFYYHVDLDYTLSRIYLPEHTVLIKKLSKRIISDAFGGLWGFRNPWDFHKFMQANWQQHALNNHKKLATIVELFNQSFLVDNRSSFLIRFTIIEICMGGQEVIEDKFVSILTPNAEKERYDKALAILLGTISYNDAEAFKNKWKWVSQKLAYKPIEGPLKNFLEKQNLPVSKFPISIDRLRKIRNKLTHGSTKRVMPEELDQANVLLYRITGILILNLLGINEWTLDTDLS